MYKSQVLSQQGVNVISLKVNAVNAALTRQDDSLLKFEKKLHPCQRKCHFSRIQTPSLHSNLQLTRGGFGKYFPSQNQQSRT